MEYGWAMVKWFQGLDNEIQHAQYFCEQQHLCEWSDIINQLVDERFFITDVN